MAFDVRRFMGGALSMRVVALAALVAMGCSGAGSGSPSSGGAAGGGSGGVSGSGGVDASAGGTGAIGGTDGGPGGTGGSGATGGGGTGGSDGGPADGAAGSDGGAPAPLKLETANAFGALLNASYSLPFRASGGAGDYSWSVVSGSLPPGLSLTPKGSPSAVLSGKPSQAGTFQFGLQVADSQGAKDTQSYSLTVNAPHWLYFMTSQIPGQGPLFALDVAQAGAKPVEIPVPAPAVSMTAWGSASDGSRFWVRDVSNRLLIVRTDSAGQHAAELVPGSLDVSHFPAWAPDSRKLLVHLDGQLKIVDTSGNPSQIFAGPNTNQAVWDPSAERLAWETYTNPISDVYVTEVGSQGMGATKKLWTGGVVLTQYIRWSPDGTHLLFSDAATLIGVRMFPEAGPSQAALVTPLGGWDSIRRRRCPGGLQVLSESQGVVTRVDFTAAAPLPTKLFTVQNPTGLSDIAPDCSGLTFTGYQKPLTYVSVGGAGTPQLIDSVGGSGLKWSSDSIHVAYDGKLAAVTGGSPFDQGTGFAPTWPYPFSHDGRWLLMASLTELRAVDVQQKPWASSLVASQTVSSPIAARWSPSSRHFAYATQSSGITLYVADYGGTGAASPVSVAQLDKTMAFIWPRERAVDFSMGFPEE